MSKQRSHRPRHESHEEKAAAIHQGKQGWQKDTEAGTSQQAAGYEQDKRFAGHQDYTEEHARVLSALTNARQAHDGEAVYLDEGARCTGLPREMTRALLHDLAAVHRLVTILQGTDNMMVVIAHGARRTGAAHRRHPSRIRSGSAGAGRRAGHAHRPTSP